MNETSKITRTNSSVCTGHRRTTIAVDGETIGWVERFDGDRAWSATAVTHLGTVDRGDWYSRKADAIDEVIDFAGGAR